MGSQSAGVYDNFCHMVTLFCDAIFVNFGLLEQVPDPVIATHLVLLLLLLIVGATTTKKV